MLKNTENHEKPLPFKDCGWILLISCIFFSFFTGAWFHGDDFSHLYNLSGRSGNPYLKALFGHVYGQGTEHVYRPITYILLALLTEGDSSFPFRITTLFIHLSSGLMLWLVFNKLAFSRFAAFFATLLFLMNPSISTSVFWISAMGDLLSTAFALCGLYFFLSNPGGGLNLTTAKVTVFFILGLLSKEICIVLPAVLFMVSIYRNSIRKDLFIIVVLCLTGVIYLILRESLLGPIALAGSEKYSFFSLVQSSIISLAKYFYFILVPLPAHWIWKHPFLNILALFQIFLVIAFVKKKGLLKGSIYFLSILIFLVIFILPVINAFAGWRLYFFVAGWSIVLGLILTELSHPLIRPGVVLYTIIFMLVMGYWGNAFLEAGKYEQRFLSELSKTDEKKLTILGVPSTAFSAVPLLTNSGKIEYALKYFYNMDKEIKVILPATIENLSILPEIKKISDNHFQISLPGNGYNFFNITSNKKSAIIPQNTFFSDKGFPVKINKTNFLGKTTVVEIKIPVESSVYFYNNENLLRLSSSF